MQLIPIVKHYIYPYRPECYCNWLDINHTNATICIYRSSGTIIDTYYKSVKALFTFETKHQRNYISDICHKHSACDGDVMMMCSRAVNTNVISSYLKCGYENRIRNALIARNLCVCVYGDIHINKNVYDFRISFVNQSLSCLVISVVGNSV